MVDVPPGRPSPLVSSDMYRNIATYRGIGTDAGSRDIKKRFIQEILNGGRTGNEILGRISFGDDVLFNEIRDFILQINPGYEVYPARVVPPPQVFEIGGRRRQSRKRKSSKGKMRRRRQTRR